MIKIRLTDFEAQVLSEVAKKHGIESRVFFEKTPTCQTATLSEDDADDLRECCSEYLLEIGFDVNYNPNKKGSALESLVDKLLV